MNLNNNPSLLSSEARLNAPGRERQPPGLFLLFFVEMWERFSFYGMRALLTFYLIKGFLQARDDAAYAIYGAYGALVYATPYLGGIFADRFIGARLAVIWGGLLMAAGHLLMTIEAEWALFGALALLICGNGFFKPNISTMVGRLYGARSPARDAGFTIFYMGINLGAALAPLVCGYIGETYGWHYGFGLATIGMLVGLGTFLAPRGVARTLILLTSLAIVVTMFWGAKDDKVQTLLNLPIALALLGAGFVSFTRLGSGSIPADLGCPRTADGTPSAPKHLGRIIAGTLIAVPLFAWLVASQVDGFTISGSTVNAGSAAEPFIIRPATWLLNIVGVVAFGSIIAVALKSPRIERDRLLVIVILCFFSMLFWAFFEQGGSSVNNFTDRNIDRVTSGTSVIEGQAYSNVAVTQEFLGVEVAGRTWTLRDIEIAQRTERQPTERAGWTILDFVATQQDVDAGVRVDGQPVVVGNKYTVVLSWREFLQSATLPIERQTERESLPQLPDAERAAAGRVTFVAESGDVQQGLVVGGNEIKASVFQAVNPTFILLLGPVFSWLWLSMGRRDPSPGVKFALGIFQLGLGFGCFWLGARFADANGMVQMEWLLLGLLLQTTGELCLSPVGLSLVTKISPIRMVSTIMGAWFLATSFSHMLAASIAKLTGIEAGEGGSIPPPSETLHIYGDVFGIVALSACGAALLLLVISPFLRARMHLDADPSSQPAA
jgi:POT family proton-dependent oligopeptide transporter